MIRLLSTVLIMLIAFSSLACQKEQEPPPPALTGQGSVLPPLYLSGEKLDSKIVGPAGEARAVPTSDQTDETAEVSTEGQIAVDDSSPEAVVQTYVKMLSAKQHALWPEPDFCIYYSEH